MDDIVRDKERIKETGEVFTPAELVEIVLQEIFERDPFSFTDKDATWCDPTCGDGNFLVAVLKWKLRHNKERAEGKETPICDILRSIYGLDLLEENTKQAVKRMINVIVEEFGEITENTERNYRKILCGRDSKPGRIVGGISALEWDFEKWRPIKITVSEATEGLIDYEDKISNESTQLPLPISQPSVPHIMGGEFFS
jgi:hypothetical protein